MKVACIIPTYNGKAEFSRLLDSLFSQSIKFDIFVIDSSSKDGTQELAKKRLDNVSVISTIDFNHGGTRQRMIDQHSEYDIFIFLTQDTYFTDGDALRKILMPFADRKVGAVCGRQLPHLDASPLAQHARQFNYPEETRIKSINDVRELGIKVAFMSNSFAAYRSNALNEIGGFPSHVIFAEDMYVAAKMLLQGWKVAYCGDAQCLHSHNYTIMDEFSRYFDMGVFHARESWIRKQFGGAGGEGMRYVKSELTFLGLQRLHLWPSSILRNLTKLIAYKLGQQEAKLPIGLKRKLGMHKRFWDGPFASSVINNGN